MKKITVRFHIYRPTTKFLVHSHWRAIFMASAVTWRNYQRLLRCLTSKTQKTLKKIFKLLCGKLKTKKNIRAHWQIQNTLQKSLFRRWSVKSRILQARRSEGALKIKYWSRRRMKEDLLKLFSLLHGPLSINIIMMTRLVFDLALESNGSFK